MLTSAGVLRAGVLATSDLVLHLIRPVDEGVVVARPELLRQTRSTPWVVNSLGALQGGVVAMTIEFAVEAVGKEALGEAVTILDLAINYLSLVRVGPARTQARMLRADDRQALLRVELRDAGNEDRLCTVATALVHV